MAVDLETRVVSLERLLERVRSKAKGDVERLTRHNRKLARELEAERAKVANLEAELRSLDWATSKVAD